LTNLVRASGLQRGGLDNHGDLESVPRRLDHKRQTADEHGDEPHQDDRRAAVTEVPYSPGDELGKWNHKKSIIAIGCSATSLS
jgi:hypothetical protein